ncbi:MAG: heme exporter protein CcmB, partial [Candidatus Subteraquimicrobiales bacterium]|nr:heme exporter protein CcmB [Candidatus Subteraquimicrobiales bacterium]
MRFFKSIMVLVQKDLALELRTKEMFNSMIIFVLLSLVIFNFAFGEAIETSDEFLGGILWVSFLFAAVLGLNRVFVHEKDEACLDGLMLVPTERSFIYFGKAIATFLFLSVVEIVALPIFSILFGVNLLLNPFLLLLVLLLSNIGIAAVGTLLSAISINTKARDLMLPILFFP